MILFLFILVTSLAVKPNWPISVILQIALHANDYKLIVTSTSSPQEETDV